MTTQIKLLLGLLILVAIALGITLYVSGDELTPEPPQRTDQPNEEAPVEIASDDPAPRTDMVGEERTAVDDRLTDGRDWAQGVQGRVVDEFGTAVPNATVFLMNGFGLGELSDKLRTWERDRVRFPPVAQGSTVADGSFMLGVEEWIDGQEFEVRVVHDSFCEGRLQRINIQPRDWYDTGAISLTGGVAVYGRVTTETGLPVPNAEITVNRPNSLDHVSPTPGREGGVIAKTDSNGNYEITHVDPTNTFSITAVAENFSTEEKRDLRFQDLSRFELNFQLGMGLTIGGTLASAEGEAVSNARVTVAALSQKSTQTEEVYSDREGFFLAEGLRAGVYSVIVEARDFIRVDERPIMAGTENLALTLETQGGVEITVLDKSGSPMSAFDYRIRAAFEGNNYGNPIVTNRVNRATSGTVLVSGLNPMTYVAEIQAEGHAKNFSERFTVVSGRPEPKVEVRMNEGGTISGVILDIRGDPVTGAKVSTKPSGWVDNPFFNLFNVEHTITDTDVRSDQKGKFGFSMIYPGEYQLKLEHPDYSTKMVDNVFVTGRDDPEQVLQMEKGCLVFGVATLDSKPTGQIKINVRALGGEATQVGFSTQAISDNEGKFLLTKRLVPGKYEVMAAPQTEQNILVLMVMYKQSTKQFTVTEGQEELDLGINCTSIKK